MPAALLTLTAFVCAAAAPEERAIAYLGAEVPAWSRDNGCFSCHNNGDAARALYFAARQRRPLPPAALTVTTGFLAEPGKWDRNSRGNPAAGDKKLSTIQFAAALAAALESGAITDRAKLISAARLLLPFQSPDGAFPIDDPGAAVGSPATYGTALATAVVRRTLAAASPEHFAAAIAKADHWLDALQPRSTLDASAVLLARPARTANIATILAAQSSAGAWGPYSKTPDEPFDTAVAMLALQPFAGQAEVARSIARARDYLIRTQLPAGGWPATTRPPGAQSYAQHMSTTGWAALALLSTDPKP